MESGEQGELTQSSGNQDEDFCVVRSTSQMTDQYRGAEVVGGGDETKPGGHVTVEDAKKSTRLEGR